jgi:hypothetical protein
LERQTYSILLSFQLVEPILASSSSSPTSIFPRANPALLYWLNTCSAALLHVTKYDFDCCDLASVEQARRPTSIAQILLASNKRIESQSNQTQGSAALCPCPDPQRFGRSFGDSSVRELAYDILRILPSIS